MHCPREMKRITVMAQARNHDLQNEENYKKDNNEIIITLSNFSEICDTW